MKVLVFEASNHSGYLHYNMEDMADEQIDIEGIYRTFECYYQSGYVKYYPFCIDLEPAKLFSLVEETKYPIIVAKSKYYLIDDFQGEVPDYCLVIYNSYME